MYENIHTSTHIHMSMYTTTISTYPHMPRYILFRTSATTMALIEDLYLWRPEIVYHLTPTLQLRIPRLFVLTTSGKNWDSHQIMLLMPWVSRTNSARAEGKLEQHRAL